MSIKARLTADIKDAMRARDQKKLDVLRLISSAIKQIEVDERIEVDDARALSLLDKLAKQRKESISQFSDAGRDDLVAQEEFELAMIRDYLPAPMSEDEIQSLIDQTITAVGAKNMMDMGKVMAELKAPLQGRADMGKVSALIKARLCKA